MHCIHFSQTGFTSPFRKKRNFFQPKILKYAPLFSCSVLAIKYAKYLFNEIAAMQKHCSLMISKIFNKTYLTLLVLASCYFKRSKTYVPTSLYKKKKNTCPPSSMWLSAFLYFPKLQSGRLLSSSPWFLYWSQFSSGHLSVVAFTLMQYRGNILYVLLVCF